ncbi:MAG: shikimate kinase [Planctomycetota bacterium]
MTDVSRGRNLVLIGCRGCGKTTVGRALAARLGWVFVDTDERVAALAGRPIATIFATDGEAAFRELESRVIAAAIHRRDACATPDTPADVGHGGPTLQGSAGVSPAVLSVGGGAVLSEANRAALRQAGLCIWLTAPADELHRRVMSDPDHAADRPALTHLDGPAEMQHLLREREPLYAALADHVVSTAGRSLEEVVEIVRRLAETPGPSADKR